MNFDYTFINLFGFKLYEPVTILTNTFIGIYCLYVFLKLVKHPNQVIQYWAMFYILISLSSTIGSVTHGVHEQLGERFLYITWFSMNAVSLLAMYYFFNAAYGYYHLQGESMKLIYRNIVAIWVIALLVITALLNNFLIIKIHAGLVLTYSLIVHLLTHYKKAAGSMYIVWGIAVSFLSIVVHSLKLSVHEWFNYKDISHIIMLTSLIIIYRGLQIKFKTNPALSFH